MVDDHSVDDQLSTTSHKVTEPSQVEQKYTRLAKTEPGVSKMGWVDKLQQALHFEVLLNLNWNKTASILDVGCGFGDLLTWLIERDFQGKYTGLDLMPVFIKQAKTRFNHRPQTHFIATDIQSASLDIHDFVFASGLFDYKMNNHLNWWQETIKYLFSKTKLALAWNGYYHCPPKRNDMWAVELTQVITLCQHLSPYWQLRTDYAPGNYTATIFKQEYWLSPALLSLIGHLFLDPSLLNTLQNNPAVLAKKYKLTFQQLNLLDPLLHQ